MDEGMPSHSAFYSLPTQNEYLYSCQNGTLCVWIVGESEAEHLSSLLLLPSQCKNCPLPLAVCLWTCYTIWVRQRHCLTQPQQTTRTEHTVTRLVSGHTKGTRASRMAGITDLGVWRTRLTQPSSWWKRGTDTAFIGDRQTERFKSSPAAWWVTCSPQPHLTQSV